MMLANYPGQRIVRDDQAYVRVGSVDHLCRDGRPTVLSVFRSHCATCGDAFEFRTVQHTGGRSLNRRCEKHKRPGSPVKGRAQRKAEAEHRRQILEEAEAAGLFN